jgi:hypothetical protein
MRAAVERSLCGAAQPVMRAAVERPLRRAAQPVTRAAVERPLRGATQSVVRAALVEPSRARLLLLLLSMRRPTAPAGIPPAVGGGRRPQNVAFTEIQ